MDKSLSLLVVGVTWPLETFLERLLRGLTEHGVKVTLASAHRPDAAWLADTGIRWFDASVWSGVTFKNLIRLMWYSLPRSPLSIKDIQIIFHGLADKDFKTRLAAWYGLIPFAGRRWDVIYFPWNFAAVHYSPLFEMGMPVIISCRGSQINIAPHNKNRLEFMHGLRKSLKRATYVHCVSDDISEKTITLGADRERIVVIRPAVNPDFFTPRPVLKDRKEFRVVMNGTLTWVKGYEYALSSIQQLAKTGVPVYCDIIGDGPEKKRLEFTIQDLQLQKVVNLLGKCTPDQIRNILHNADVFLLSSLSEGISNAALEAMSCGLPVVSTDCGGMREAVTDKVDGFITLVRDPHAMTIALNNLWENPEMAQKMGDMARGRIMSDFQLDNQLVKWMILLNSIKQFSNA